MQARKLYNEGLEKGSAMDRRYGALLEQKWAPFLRGVEDPWKRQVLAFLYENEANYVGGLTEDSPALSVNVPDFVRYAFPLVRRVWPNLIANDLLSVQPMSAPVGGIFYFEYKAGTSKGSISAGDNLIQNFDRYWTSEYVYEQNLATGNGATAHYTGTLPFYPVQPYSQYRTGIEFFGTSGGTLLRIYDGDGSGTLTGDTGGASTVNYTTGAYDVTFSGNIDNGAAVYVNYFCDMENGTGANVPEMYVDISLTPIKAGSRKLKTKWSSEASDDFRAMVGVDVEAQLVAGAASEIQLELDQDLIMYMYGSNTPYTATWDATVPAGRNEISYYANILTQLTKLSNQIFTGTKRGPANWMVVSADVSNILTQLEKHGDFKSVFTLNPQPVGMGTGGRPSFDIPRGPAGYGIYQLGLLQSRWAVYLNPYFPAGKVLLGLKGPTPWDSGTVFAPYVPLQVSEPLHDPGTFTTVRGLRTRYEKKVVDNHYYAVLTVNNTP